MQIDSDSDNSDDDDAGAAVLAGGPPAPAWPGRQEPAQAEDAHQRQLRQGEARWRNLETYFELPRIYLQSPQILVCCHKTYFLFTVWTFIMMSVSGMCHNWSGIDCLDTINQTNKVVGEL